MNKKPIALIGLLCLCLLILTACHGYSLYEVEDDVESAYMFCYENPEVRNVNDLLGRARRADFDFYRMLPIENIEILPNEKLQDFIAEVSGRYLFDHANHPNGANGLVIMIYYESGKFDIISSAFVGRYTQEGRNTEFFGNWTVDDISDLDISDLGDTFFSEDIRCTTE